jgi:F-type H+-transporting ATPase subunit gamma
MAALKTIKTKIIAMKKSQTVTKAMEAVSAAKMRKSQQKALGGRAYARAAAATLSRVAGSRSLNNHPLAAVRPVTRALYIVITSDKGLAGALNSAVLRATTADIGDTQTSVIAIGKKANDYFTARNYPVAVYHPNTVEADSVLVNTIVNEAATRFVAGEVDVVKVAYQNFISTFEQRPTIRTVFPLSLEDLQRVVADIAPSRGAYAEPQESVESRPGTYTVEPSEGDVLGAILPLLASVIVYHALLESQASEHSARMVAMKSASDKAGEKQGELTLQFNKARQASITREVSEITGP